MTELIEDLVVLGRAVPERLKNGRATVCLGGWSASKGFIRIYPTRLKMPLKTWGVLSVEVERNDQDNREESWKIVGSQSDWDSLYKHAHLVGYIVSPDERRRIVETNLSSCIATLNEGRKSLGIIKPSRILDRYFGTNPQHEEPDQLFMFPDQIEDFESWAQIKRDFEVEPRLKYVCPDCRVAQGYHDQKILEWGFYEWMRKHPNNLEQVWDNAKFGSEKHDIYLFVGNQANQRTSFIIISVLRIPKTPVVATMNQSKLF